jgi:hypothetical protein
VCSTQAPAAFSETELSVQFELRLTPPSKPSDQPHYPFHFNNTVIKDCR